MSAGDGNWTAVFSGTVNRLATGVVGARADGASLDGSNCHGVSGEGGAKSRVSLQAPSSTNPANAMRRSLTGGMQCISNRRRSHRRRLRTNLVEDLANVPVQQVVPRRERREVITRAGQGRRFRRTGCHFVRSFAVARP